MNVKVSIWWTTTEKLL